MLAVIKCCVLILTAAVAAPLQAETPPIIAIKKVAAQPQVFKMATRKKPFVVQTKDEASKCFSESSLQKLLNQVDLQKQQVLIFAWSGSGQDRITYDVAESVPEQVHFSFRAGRTRDLRPHVQIFALRRNVKWHFK